MAWNPGADPYTGTLQEAHEDFLNAGADPYVINLLALAAERTDAGLPSVPCYTARIKPNEYFSLMESGHGLMSSVVAPEQWPEHLSPYKFECRLNGHALAKPFVCNNWAYTPPLAAPPALPAPPGWVSLPSSPEWLPGPWVSGWGATQEAVEAGVFNNAAGVVGVLPEHVAAASVEVPTPHMLAVFVVAFGLALLLKLCLSPHLRV